MSILHLPVLDRQQRQLGTLGDAVNRRCVLLSSQFDSVYLTPELLLCEDQWFCPRCKTRRDSTKYTTITKLPKVLIIHLIRFAFNDGQFSKLKAPLSLEATEEGDFVVKFPIRQKEYVYKLVALINHQGRYHGGHYSTVCYHSEDHQ